MRLTINTQQKAMTMKTIKKIFGVAACIGILAASATTVFGQAGLIFTFDENGNGNLNGQPIPFTVIVEPLSGIPTLRYSLPFLTAPGDVLVTEPAEPGAPYLSDIVRFDAVGNVYFFSDLPDPGENPDLADVGIPNVISPYVIVAEQGTDVYNYGVWVPTAADQPGFVVTGAPIQYMIISDVPEPSSLLLATLGGGLLFLLKSRRQVRRD